ncbi:hypothetical protein BDN72DRAFT_337883 [Pluteus cervinus]|uniref:Uncharacterized protein n=1 Tax=Pluteus cervinus TaxID=181527 RepID=A0ACD3ABY2_9AGAR|nr:hypothetical protein BDN72DRAFT_337883 [Pluteus cervinus]
MNNLPSEVVHNIVSYHRIAYPVFTSDHPHACNYHSTPFLLRWLGSICSLNRVWYTATMPILYSTIILNTDPHRRQRNQDKLASIKTNGRFVRHLIVNLTEKAGQAGSDEDVFDELGAHLPRCTYLHISMQTHTTKQDFRRLHGLLQSFDHSQAHIRSLRLRSASFRSHMIVKEILLTIPAIVISQLEALEISGWEINADYPPELSSRFWSIKRLSLVRLYSPSGLTWNPTLAGILNSLSSLAPLSASLEWLYIADSHIPSSSVITFLQTPSRTSSPLAPNIRTIGFQLTYLHIDITMHAITIGKWNISDTPFVLISICPNLRTFLYFVPCPLTFILPGDDDMLPMSPLGTQTLPDLAELGLRVMKDTWPSSIHSGNVGLILEWASSRERQGNLRRFVLRCDSTDNYNEVKKRVEENTRSIDIEVQMSQRGT